MNIAINLKYTRNNKFSLSKNIIFNKIQNDHLLGTANFLFSLPASSNISLNLRASIKQNNSVIVFKYIDIKCKHIQNTIKDTTICIMQTQTEIFCNV